MLKCTRHIKSGMSWVGNLQYLFGLSICVLFCLRHNNNASQSFSCPDFHNSGVIWHICNEDIISSRMNTLNRRVEQPPSHSRQRTSPHIRPDALWKPHYLHSFSIWPLSRVFHQADDYVFDNIGSSLNVVRYICWCFLCCIGPARSRRDPHPSAQMWSVMMAGRDRPQEHLFINRYYISVRLPGQNIEFRRTWRHVESLCRGHVMWLLIYKYICYDIYMP